MITGIKRACLVMTVAPFLKEIHSFLDILNDRALHAFYSPFTKESLFKNEIASF